MGLTEIFDKCNVLGSVIMNLDTIKDAVINTGTAGHLQSIHQREPDLGNSYQYLEQKSCYKFTYLKQKTTKEQYF